MSTISDFNRIDDCDKIDALCVDSYTDFGYDPDNETGICLHTPWGGECLDLTDIVRAAETCTTLHLSPEENPNCLVYEPECGDNICIHGDDLSRIISMRYLKDVKQGEELSAGDVYMYNNDGFFHTFALQDFVTNTNTSISNITARVSAAEGNITNLQTRMTTAEGNITNLNTRMGTAEGNITNLQTTVGDHETRIAAIEAILTKPAGAPNEAKVAWGTINLYSDHNAVVNSSGVATTLDKTHGLYTHDLNINAAEDELFG